LPGLPGVRLLLEGKAMRVPSELMEEAQLRPTVD
jgi:hypothetical protein